MDKDKKAMLIEKAKKEYRDYISSNSDSGATPKPSKRGPPEPQVNVDNVLS